MLDEPPIMVEEGVRVIGEINRTGVGMLPVEQNTEHALSLAHRGFVPGSGLVVLLANERVRQAYVGL